MKIIFYPAISLDGLIARTNGDSNWVTEEDESLFADEVRKAGCVIVGSHTFKQYQGIIYPISNATTFICTSHSTNEIKDQDVQYVSGEVEDILKQIEKAGFTTAVLSGGANTNGRFALAKAIDEMIVSIYPMTLGEGLPIFGTARIPLRLELINSKELKFGIIQNRYKVIF